MGKGGYNQTNLILPEYSVDDVKQHNTKTDSWIVIDQAIYNVTTWKSKHPGGARMLSNYAGQDASEAWYAFHPDKQHVQKFMKPLLIGKLAQPTDNIDIRSKESSMISDFRKLRKVAEDMGLFKSNWLFFTLHLLHILAFDGLGWAVMWYWGTGWLAYCTAAVFLCVAQIQAGWNQHDYGHLSVFRSFKFNHGIQIFILNVIKGASSEWWNYRHLNHHAKPNVLTKDPDVSFLPLFLLGKVLPLKWGKDKKKVLPYQHQHLYFFFILPPFLLPLYFNYEIPYFLIKRKSWKELGWTSIFFLRWYLMFGSMLGLGGILFLFFFVRFLESHWFVWTTQMNHIPMEVEYDQNDNWVTMQLKATCNVEQSFFNDWFSGHLNFQIEHHLFPTMPRHSYHKVAPLVQSFCKKHHLDYQCKPMLKAFADIVGSLKSSGRLWYEAYNM